jgi:tRNA (guanine-N7-)-methyltransferase
MELTTATYEVMGPNVGQDKGDLSRPLRPRPRMALTRDLRHPTEYVRLMNEDLSQWAFNEERAVKMVGKWRAEVLKTSAAHPLDLEIGTGNGYHFAHLAKSNPERSLVGIEIKFKPLIQSIKRALRVSNGNARIVRYDANRLEDLFAVGELNNVYIHHPDPWLKKRQWKHRLIQPDFLDILFGLMRPGSYMDFKTDSADYFEWAAERFHGSKFRVVRETRDLHKSEWASENFVTHFESIFLAQGLPIHYARLVRD